MLRLAWLFVLLVSITRAAHSMESNDLLIEGVPLPGDAVQRAQRAEAVAPEDGFAGTWTGAWDGVLRHILIVDPPEPDGRVGAVYAVADNPYGAFKRAWFPMTGTVSGSRLSLSNDRFTVTYDRTPMGRLRGVFADNAGFAVLRRQSLAPLLAADKPVSWTWAERGFLETELSENGKPVRLEAILFKPEGSGPFPLAIVNHGSTGFGRDPARFGHTWFQPWLADFLNERGWMVAFPQRRGRGRSEGLYDEGFGEDRSRGYTCKTERSLAGADRALIDIDAAVTALRRRPDVTDDPVLMVGQSRGGALSVAYAGLHPKDVHGVVNFVGGWMGDGCSTATTINQSLLLKGASFDKPGLWLYGRDDVYYNEGHTQKNFAAFRAANGLGRFEIVDVPGQQNGHSVLAIPPLWMQSVDDYLKSLVPPRQ
ncbi:MAG: alpha/beta fold hydrolase [Pseudomonadota bacterium]